ncbi:SH3 domain-containing protein [Methylocystis sp. JAN1]|uniref:SH3 domain-containing protein n=1 Tax=Methylocystis sp. JAN1 TaxID=3397211 RepID=UPI003FA2C54A
MSFGCAKTRLMQGAIFMGFIVAAHAAAATEFCNVKRTPDGFVALREAPDPRARLVGRMTHGDEVLGDPTIESRCGWMFVTWWKGGRFRSGYEFEKPTGKGWVNSRLIEEECG